jgi:aspartokinase
MPDVKLPDAAFTWDTVVYIVAVLVAVSGVLVALVKGWEAWRKISVRDRVKDLEGRMTKVEARLRLGDKRFDLQNDDMGHILNTQMALLVHFVSGNDHDRLRDQITALSEYMSQRATKLAAYESEHEQIQNGGGQG